MLDAIKKMKEELKALQEKMASLSEENSKLKEELAEKEENLKADIEKAMAGRKVTASVKSDDKEVEKAVGAMKDEYLKSVILGKSFKQSDVFKNNAELVEKALKPADVGDWVAEAFSKDIIGKVELDLVVANSFDEIAVPANYGSLSVPTITSGLTAYLIQPAASAIESVISGGKINIKPQKMKVLTALTDEVNEETVTAVLERTKAELARGIAKGIEEVVINGDTGISDANDVKKIANGLLKTGKNAKVDAGGDDLVLVDLTNARLALGNLGVNPSELMLVVRPETYIKFVQNTSEVLTIDKMGSYATIRSGVLGSIFGIEIVVSELIPTNLAANGDAGGDKTAALLVNKRAFVKGTRNGLVLSEADRDIKTDVDLLTSRYFLDFKQLTVPGDVGVSAIVNLA